MNKAVILVIFVAAMGAWIAFRYLGRHPRTFSATPAPKKDSADMSRELRRLMLTTSPQETGAKPTPEFPRVYGILMDWPLGEQIATVFSSSSGAASLYTTSAFGIIGGEGHETVRAAAKALVAASDRHFAEAKLATEFPYPGADRVRFYLLTLDGVRAIETDLASITNGTSKYAELFGLGQAVLTELRLVTERRQCTGLTGVCSRRGTGRSPSEPSRGCGTGSSRYDTRIRGRRLTTEWSRSTIW